MIVKNKLKFQISEYREKKELYEACGYQEVKYYEKGINCIVTFEIDTAAPHYLELKQAAKELRRSGPPYYPTFIFVGLSFIFLSIFVVLLINSVHKNIDFELWANIVSFLLPAVLFLAATVIYTYFYFKINERIISSAPFSKEEFIKKIETIKQK